MHCKKRQRAHHRSGRTRRAGRGGQPPPRHLFAASADDMYDARHAAPDNRMDAVYAYNGRQTERRKTAPFPSQDQRAKRNAAKRAKRAKRAPHQNRMWTNGSWLEEKRIRDRAESLRLAKEQRAATTARKRSPSPPASSSSSLESASSSSSKSSRSRRGSAAADEEDILIGWEPYDSSSDQLRLLFSKSARRSCLV